MPWDSVSMPKTRLLGYDATAERQIWMLTLDALQSRPRIRALRCEILTKCCLKRAGCAG